MIASSYFLMLYQSRMFCTEDSISSHSPFLHIPIYLWVAFDMNHPLCTSCFKPFEQALVNSLFCVQF